MREFQQDARGIAKTEKPLVVPGLLERLSKAVDENTQLTNRMSERLSVVRMEEPCPTDAEKMPQQSLPALPGALLDILTRVEKNNDCLRYNLRTIQI